MSDYEAAIEVRDAINDLNSDLKSEMRGLSKVLELHLADIAASLRTIARALENSVLVAVPPDPQPFSPPKGEPS